IVLRPRFLPVAYATLFRSRVRFLGFVPEEDLPLVYRAADAFAISGIAELQSIATLEAMASGLPVVAADAMALPHLVHVGRNGYRSEEHTSELQSREKLVCR